MYCKCEVPVLFVQAVRDRADAKGTSRLVKGDDWATLLGTNPHRLPRQWWPHLLLYSGSASGNWFVEITLLKWGSRIHRARRNIIPFNEQPLHKQAGLRFFYSFFLIFVIVTVLKTTSFQFLTFLKWTFHIITWSSTGLELLVTILYLCISDGTSCLWFML